MATYLMLGKYTSDSLQKINADRTKRAIDLIVRSGGEVKEIYALLGAYDLAFLVDFRDNMSAIKGSLSVSQMTGISLTTSPAISIQEFDRLVAAE